MDHLGGEVTGLQITWTDICFLRVKPTLGRQLLGLRVSWEDHNLPQYLTHIPWGASERVQALGETLSLEEAIIWTSDIPVLLANPAR